MTSLGKPSFRSAVAWFCVEMESVVKLLVLQCYGFTKSWIRLARFLNPMSKASVQRSFQVVHKRASKLKSEDEKEESDSKLRGSFEAALVWIRPWRLSQSECSYGAEPISLGRTVMKIPCDKQ